MPRNTLLVAYHFPPLQGSSGLQRALAFARFLPDYDWRAHVLTVTEGAYPQTNPAIVDPRARKDPDGPNGLSLIWGGPRFSTKLVDRAAERIAVASASVR